MLKPIIILSAGVLFLASCTNTSTTGTNCATATDSLQKEIAARDTRINVLLDSLKMMGSNNTAATTVDTTTTTTATTATEPSGAGTTGHSFYKSTKRKTSGASADMRAKYPGEFPEGSARILTEKDLMFLSPWGLKVIQNEIYARHGMKFTDGDLKNHFSRQGWYHPSADNVSGKLSATEKQNLEFIKNYKFNPQIGV